MLGQLGETEGPSDSEEDKGPHIQASKMPADRRGERNADALKAKMDAEYETLVPARHKIVGVSIGVRRAFRRHGLYGRREGLQRTSVVDEEDAGALNTGLAMARKSKGKGPAEQK